MLVAGTNIGSSSEYYKVYALDEPVTDTAVGEPFAQSRFTVRPVGAFPMTSPSKATDHPKPVVEPSPTPADPATRALQQRIRQQEILAELGVVALQGKPFLELLKRSGQCLRRRDSEAGGPTLGKKA